MAIYLLFAVERLVMRMAFSKKEFQAIYAVTGNE